MIRIALCDDEQEILDSLSLYIKEYSEKGLSEPLEAVPFHSADALLSAIEDSCPFDVFILDVYIGERMGTDLARAIRKRGIESPIIFLTTSIDHAPESFEMGTLRYLIKPINPAKLYEAIDAAITQFEKQRERLVKLKTEEGAESINASRIVYSEAHDHYQYVMLMDGRQIKVRMTVADLYAILAKSDGFIRVGSAYIINLRNVKTVTTSEVRLYSGYSIPVPRGKSAEIRSAFWDYQYEGGED